jgi:hypothetical protein
MLYYRYVSNAPHTEPVYGTFTLNIFKNIKIEDLHVFEISDQTFKNIKVFGGDVENPKIIVEIWPIKKQWVIYILDKPNTKNIETFALKAKFGYVDIQQAARRIKNFFKQPNLFLI